MEMNELKYFLAVAKTENMQRASVEIGVSAGSLSKAISRLENELQVKLFKKVGRHIVLSDYGRFLKEKGNDLIGLESSIKTQIMGEGNTVRINIAGDEVLLSSFGVSLSQEILKSHKNTIFTFENSSHEVLVSRVRDGEVDIGISTYDVPSEFDQKIISSISFNTYISSKHPLAKRVKGNVLPVSEVLKFPFVVPQNNILGKINKSDSTDGWRDDKFPRHISYRSSSYKTIENLVLQGRAIAYLPDFLAEDSGMVKISISGCPYTSKQKVRMFTRDKKRNGLLNSLF